MQCKVLTILLVVHQSGWGEVVSSGYRASRRGWGTEAVSHRLRQSRSAASSLSTFVMPSKCVRACNVPTDRGKEGGGRDILALWLQESCMCMSMQLARSLASSRSNVWSQFKMSIRACSHEMRLLQQRYSSSFPPLPAILVCHLVVHIVRVIVIVVMDASGLLHDLTVGQSVQPCPFGQLATLVRWLYGHC